jgi:tRNA threonylcarbamoyl adenosine modification protein YeaZ
VNLLAFHTASEPASAALLTAGEARARMLRRGRTNEELAPAASELLAEAGLAAAGLDGVAAARGPGSFTGLRVGAATAMGVARGAGVPLFAAGTLDVWAAAAFDAAAGGWSAPAVGGTAGGAAARPAHAGLRRIVRVVLDARRGEVYAGGLRLEGGVPDAVDGPAALTAADALTRIETDALVVGDGRPLLIAAGMPSDRPGFEQPPGPLALALARLVARDPDRFACGRAGLVLSYVRRPQAVEALRAPARRGT